MNKKIYDNKKMSINQSLTEKPKKVEMIEKEDCWECPKCYYVVKKDKKIIKKLYDN
jgi:ubiquitin C-terminal hydrolase